MPPVIPTAEHLCQLNLLVIHIQSEVTHQKYHRIELSILVVNTIETAEKSDFGPAIESTNRRTNGQSD